MSPYLIVLAVAVAAFVLLLAFGRRWAPARPGAGRTAEIVATGMASTNIAGAVGLAWFVAEILVYDGAIMVIEASTCAALIALLAALTTGGLALGRRGKTGTALALLAVGALPTLFVYGFLVYLDNNPIDWR